MAKAETRIQSPKAKSRARALPQRAVTKTERSMAEQLGELEPGTDRYEVLKAAIAFKRSWVRLAERLAEIQRSGVFREWGYRSYEAYAQTELHLKRDTAQKLARSYMFLKEHEGPLLHDAFRSLEADDRQPFEARSTPLPSFQALDVLREARQNPYLNEDDYRSVRDAVFQEDPPPAVVKKLVRERVQEPPKEKREEDRTVRLRRSLALAERLYGALMEDEVSPALLGSMDQVVGGLRRLLED